MDNLRRRLDDLIAPVPADEAMPIDYAHRRWKVSRPAVLAAAAVGVVVLAALVVWWLRPGAVTMPDTVAASTSSPMEPPAVGDGSAGSDPQDHEGSEDLEGAVSTEPEELVVSVVGLVHHPGVVVLPPGARVSDAIAMAGGLLPEADFASVNHAARVSDGEQILVSDQPVAGSVGGGDTAGGPDGPGGGDIAGGPVNLNSADAAALESLPGVGPATARNIVSHRESNGPFSSVEQLLEVSGIGPAKFAQVKDLVTV